MKVLLDEHLSPAIAELLRSHGLDADAVSARRDLVSCSDHDVIDVAVVEDRAVVTNNIKDFRPIAAARLADGRGHAGLILLPTKRIGIRAATGYLAEAIEAVMRAYPDGIADTEHWVPPASERHPATNG